ncbi:MAG: DUF4430 domain-containing protein [bacterium]
MITRKRLIAAATLFLIAAVVLTGCACSPGREANNQSNQPHPISVVPAGKNSSDVASLPDGSHLRSDLPAEQPVTSPAADFPPALPEVVPEPSPAEVAKPEQNVATVTISIVGPEDVGTVLSPQTASIQNDATVLEVLKQVTRAEKIQMEYRGKGTSAYVEGINNLYEMDRGPKSGWMYKLNGEFPSQSAGSCSAADGDVIEWLYTLDLGRDLGADINFK